MGIYEELSARGLIAQVTDEPEVRELLNNGRGVFYIGFDPTADSLHVGHFMALSLMKRLQDAGNKPIALIGGGTAMVGDPSGRSDLRKMMDIATIRHNCDCFRHQMSRFVKFGDGPGDAVMPNNADWLGNLNYIEFLRDIGSHFNVNKMLAARCYVNRMEQGLTFLEFNYMIMQAYDFYRLHLDYGCNLQAGGDDQWSNILAGTDLIRKKLSDDAYGLTMTLLLKADGQKMGKTSQGAVWLDPDKTSPYDFFQYWRNIDDADVLKCLKLLTFLPLEEIEGMASLTGSGLNKAKEMLAKELTALVHGEEEALKAERGAKIAFTGGMSEDMPAFEVPADLFAEGSADLVSILTSSGLCSSRGDARRNIEQGGVTVGDEKVTDSRRTYTAEELRGAGVVVRRGKKNFVRVYTLWGGDAGRREFS